MRRTFSENVRNKRGDDDNCESASQKAHLSYMLHVDSSGKTTERYTIPKLLHVY